MTDHNECDACRHWHKISFSQGECRIRAPAAASPYRDETGVIMVGNWPVTDKQDWCGEWE